jgi:formiminotetrahydrofolate cyclodeaminase
MLAVGANPEMRADAVVAACLAEAASRGASHLVRINLGMAPEDDRVGTAQDHAERAAAARARALGQTARD